MLLWFSVLPIKLERIAAPAITALNYEPSRCGVDFSIYLLTSILCEKLIIFSGCCPGAKGHFLPFFS